MNRRRRLLLTAAAALGVLFLVGAGLFVPHTAPEGNEIPAVSIGEAVGNNTSIIVRERFQIDSPSRTSDSKTTAYLHYDADNRRAIVRTEYESGNRTSYLAPVPNETDAHREYIRTYYNNQSEYRDAVIDYQTRFDDTDVTVRFDNATQTIYTYSVNDDPVRDAKERVLVGRTTRNILFTDVTQPRFERVGQTTRENFTLNEYAVRNGWRSPKAPDRELSVTDASGTLLTSNETGLRKANVSYTLYGGNKPIDWLGAKLGLTPTFSFDINYEATVTNETVSCPDWVNESAGPPCDE